MSTPICLTASAGIKRTMELLGRRLVRLRATELRLAPTTPPGMLVLRRGLCSFRGSVQADSAAAATLVSAMGSPGLEADRIERFVSAIGQCRGSVLVTGVGKSAIVAKRMAASLASVGSPAHWVHGTEWVHGDLGGLRAGDVVLGLSHSGATRELLDLMRCCTEQRRGVTLLAMVGKPGSPMAAAADVALELPAIPEPGGELIGSVPTRSIVMQEMAVNGVLTELVERARFGPDDFVRNHPGGSIGASAT